MEDWRLLRQFVDTGSQEAFARLMERHRGLVYSTCRRELADSAQAEDATQVVFLVLAQKAKSLRREVVLSGWLFQTARFAARDIRKGEQRRRTHDMEAGVEMHQAEARTQRAAWQEIAPWLHDSLDRLSLKDRNAILLHFFEDQNFAEVALALGQKEDAARHRVNRALEKMRRFLAAQGVVIPVTALGALLTANALEPAPDPVFASLPVGSHLTQLAQGVLKTMWIKQMSGLAAVILGIGVLGAGAGLVRALAPKAPAAHRTSSLGGRPQRPSSNPRLRVTNALGGAAPTPAPPPQRPIREVRITGNQVVPSAAVVAALGFKAGDTVSDTRIQRSLTQVYNLAWFNLVGPFDLKPEAGGGFVLTIPVRENPGLAGTRPEEFQEQAEIASVYDAGEDAFNSHQIDQFKAIFTPNFRAVDRAGRRATLNQYLAQIEGPLGPASLIELNHYGTGSRRSGNLVVASATVTWYRWTRLPGSPQGGFEKLEQSVEDDWHRSSGGWVLETRKATSDIKTTQNPERYLRLLKSRAAQGLPY